MKTNASLKVIRSAIARVFGQTHQGARDPWESFGYPEELEPEHFMLLYKRHDIAQRIVRAFPQATFRDAPTVYDEAGSTAEESEFVHAWEQLCQRKNVLHYLERADRLASIGHYGVLLLGFRDGQDMRTPLSNRRADLLYMAPYDETRVTAVTWNTDSQDPRFNMPETYTIQTGALTTTGTRSGGRTQSVIVHHSRVLHIAEYLESDEVEGTPRLEAVYNRFKDLEKIVGGGAETFWLLANRGLALIAESDANLSDEDKKAAREQAEEYQHQLTRVLALQGIDAKSLGSETPDGSGQVGVLLDLIAGATGIPKRILIGSERGELSSEQDENNWSSRIDERRKHFAGPRMVRPFIEKMIITGNLPQPTGDWGIDWPAAAGMSDAQKADISLKRAQTLQAYTASIALGGDAIVPPEEFRQEFLGLDALPEEGFMDGDELDGDLDAELGKDPAAGLVE